jgi:AcrR family transcriptional regulator
MSRRRAAAPEPRTPLSKERVLRAALTLVDEGGLEALSMRKLAQELGVEAMSLYNHVDNKDDIVAGILDLVAAEIESPASGGDWKAAMRGRAISAHEAFSRHRWAARIWASSPRVNPDRMRDAEGFLRCLREAGFSKELTYHAFHVLPGYALGYTLQELNFPYDSEQLEKLAASFLRDLPADEYPYLVEHVTQHMEPGPHHQGDFELGLDLILDGLERLRDAD